MVETDYHIVVHLLQMFELALPASIEAHLQWKVFVLGRVVDGTGESREKRYHRTYMQVMSNCVTHPESTIPSHRKARIGVGCSVVPSGKFHLDK